MPAWFYVLAAAAVAFVAWFAFARRWVHALFYSWTRARHLAGLTQAEVIPGAEYLGSMTLGDDPNGEAIAARALRYGDIWAGPDGRGWHEVTGDWREQTRVELAPETLDLLAAPPADPGPGDSSSASPGPDQVWADRNAGRFDSAPGGPGSDHALSGAPGPPALACAVMHGPEGCPGYPHREPTRLADTGDLLAARVAHPAPDWLEGQLGDLYAWVRGMVPQVTGWSV